MEIGFGRGLFLRHYAKRCPSRFIVGVEIRKTAINLLKQRLSEENIQNVHIIHGNGEIVLQDCINDNAIDRLFLFHPDPWLKKRHQKRRIINPGFLDLAYKKLSKQGKLYISTDVETLWTDIWQTLINHSGFKRIENDPFWDMDYISHWNEFSEQQNRDIYYAAFARK
ncbi:tRNA (guanosine(46)-N7)-methyltransferase TrmB [Thermoproteota archaeon]